MRGSQDAARRRRPRASPPAKPAARKRGRPRAERACAPPSCHARPAAVLTRERITRPRDAVRRGRMTRDDAEELDGQPRGAGAARRTTCARLERCSARARTAPRTAVVRRTTPRRVAGLGRTFPIAGYDDLTAAQVRRLGDLAPAELRKVRDLERRNANRKSVLPRSSRALAPATWQRQPTGRHSPDRGAELDLASTRSPTAATASRASDGYVVFVSRRDPRRPRPRGRHEAQARLRRGAHARGARAEPRAHRAARRPPRRAVAGAALRAPARRQARAGRRRADADRQARGLRARRHRPRGRAVALSQQARVLVRRPAPTASSSAASTRPARGTRSSPVERLPAGLRALQRRARARCSRGVARAACRRWTAARTRACCATSSCARGGAPAQLQVRIVTGPGDLDTSSLAAAVEVRGPHVDAHRRARREHGRRRHVAHRRRAALEEEIGGLQLAISPRRVLSDEHRDGRAALRHRRRARRPARAGSASSTCTAGSAPSA